MTKREDEAKKICKALGWSLGYVCADSPVLFDKVNGDYQEDCHIQAIADYVIEQRKEVARHIHTRTSFCCQFKDITQSNIFTEICNEITKEN